VTGVVVRGLTAGYGSEAVLHDLDLTVPSGAVSAVLGRSGSGKTTFLRILAGFVRPAAGTVQFGDRLVAGAGAGFPHCFVPPEKRRVGIVPQEGALFPHLSVSENVGFGLPRYSESRIGELLEMVGMGSHATARPHELSGGQQQRVALARALAPRPDVVLLDEPFSSLDLALRARLRSEVCGLLRSLGTTAVLVTHDQEEALSIADLVAVLRDGRIVQAGTPAALYTEPADLELARFLGEVAELPATVVRGGLATCSLGDVVVQGGEPRGLAVAGGDVIVVLRPEQLELSRPGGDGGRVGAGVVRETAYYGHDAVVQVELADGTRVPVRTPGGVTSPPRPGEAVMVRATGVGRLYPAEPAVDRLCARTGGRSATTTSNTPPSRFVTMR